MLLPTEKEMVTSRSREWPWKSSDDRDGSYPSTRIEHHSHLRSWWKIDPRHFAVTDAHQTRDRMGNSYHNGTVTRGQRSPMKRPQSLFHDDGTPPGQSRQLWAWHFVFTTYTSKLDVLSRLHHQQRIQNNTSSNLPYRSTPLR